MRLMLSAFCSLCVLSASAQAVDTNNSHNATSKQSGTFVCTSGLSLPINSFYFEIPGSTPGVSAAPLVSITTDLSQFPNLFIAAATGKVFDSCEVQVTGKPAESQTLQFTDVSTQLVALSADKQAQYVRATFQFARVELKDANSAASIKNAPSTPPELQNKAITEFLARAPKPSAN